MTTVLSLFGIGGIGVLGLCAWLSRPGGWAHQRAADSHEARAAHDVG